MAEQQDTSVQTGGVQPPTVAEHDGWEVHSASAVDQPKPEEIVERLTDVPGDQQVEQQARQAQQDEQQAPPEAKKKSASDRNAEIRARIAAETRAYHDARRAREFEQSEIERLKAQRQQLQQRQRPAQQQKLPDKPLWAKFEEAGKSYEDFLDARAAFDRQQTIAITRKEQAQRERQGWERAQAAQHQQLIEQNAYAHDQRINEAAQKHPDFFEVVQQNLSDVPDNPFLVDVIQHHAQGAEILYHLAQNPDVARVLSTLEMSRPVADAIRMSDVPVELLSHFGQHPQELDRLNRLHPATALVALGELKAQLGAANYGSARTERISNAKPPIRPVGGGRSSTQKQSDELPFGPEWIRRENQRDRERKKSSAYF